MKHVIEKSGQFDYTIEASQRGYVATVRDNGQLLGSLIVLCGYRTALTVEQGYHRAKRFLVVFGSKEYHAVDYADAVDAAFRWTPSHHAPSN
jgi:hypothetical protein